jgi:hypothetical protein
MKSRWKFTLGALLASAAALTVAGAVLASGWVYFPKSYNQDHTHNWGGGTAHYNLHQTDLWYEYWDDGQGRYTLYSIQPGTKSEVTNYSDSQRYIFGVKAFLIKSDASQSNRVWQDYMIEPGDPTQTFYWPGSSVQFSKPADPYNDPSSMQWEYLWPGEQIWQNRWTGINCWYALEYYEYVTW